MASLNLSLIVFVCVCECVFFVTEKGMVENYSKDELKSLFL